MAGVVDLVGVGHLDIVFWLGGAKLWLLLLRFSLLLLRSRAPLIPPLAAEFEGGNGRADVPLPRVWGATEK
jgi:hypothetical protein